jgi:cobalt-zinc-cadmium efflux system outer membrane protein
MKTDLKVYIRLLFICIASLFCPTNSIAQTPVNDAVINLPDAITRTLTDNPGLRAVGNQMRVQDARILQAGIKPRPELNVEVENVLGSGPNDLFHSAQTTVSIAWILERGVREKQVAAARAGATVVETEINIRRLDAAAETARRYLLCLVLQTRMVNAIEGIQLGQEAVAAIERRVSAANTPGAELARAQADLKRLELVQEDIEHELLSAYYRLAAQWGETEPNLTRVEGNLFDSPTIENFDALEAKLEQNPDITKYLSLQRLNDAQLRLEQARSRQSWRVSTGFRWLGQTSDHGFVADLTIPIGKQDSNRGRVAEARARIAQTEAEKQAVQVRLETELFVIYQELQHSIQLTDAFTNEILPLYEQALEETRIAYEAGRYSYFEWNATQRNLLAARYDLIDAAMGIYQNLIEIERLTGVSVEVPQLTQ